MKHLCRSLSCVIRWRLRYIALSPCAEKHDMCLISAVGSERLQYLQFTPTICVCYSLRYQPSLFSCLFQSEFRRKPNDNSYWIVDYDWDIRERRWDVMWCSSRRGLFIAPNLRPWVWSAHKTLEKCKRYLKAFWLCNEKIFDHWNK